MNPDVYLVELQVFHDLHCLNMIRKAVYLDHYPDMLEKNPDGTIYRGSTNALHLGLSNLLC